MREAGYGEAVVLVPLPLVPVAPLAPPPLLRPLLDEPAAELAAGEDELTPPLTGEELLLALLAGEAELATLARGEELLLRPAELLEVVPVAARGELLLRPLVVPVDVPVVEVVLDELPLDTPVHGATVALVVVAPDCEIETPATLQFNGTCCSMISTKLISLARPEEEVVEVVVEVREVPVAPALPAAPVPETELGEALLAAPVPETELAAPTELGEALLTPLLVPVPVVPAGLLELVVVVVVVVVAGTPASRMSMKATVLPLEAMLRKLPARAIWAELELPLVVAGEALDVLDVLDELPAPEAEEPELLANEPDHWFWVMTC